MSEFVGTRCDTCGITEDIDPAEIFNEKGWIEDDKGQHFCVECQETAKDLEVSSEDIQALGELVGDSADAVLNDPSVIEFRQKARSQFEILKTRSIEQFQKELALAGKTPAVIEAETKSLIEDMEDAFNQRYGELKIGE